MSDLYQFSAINNKGEDTPLSRYKGNVVLIVNTASKCGFTYQYEGLEELQQQYEGKGFTVLAFPCNQFGHQEPGSDQDIASFCKMSYDVSFPLFKKIEVKGANAHPLYSWLSKEAPGLLGSKRIKWNFTKFLVNTNGEVVKRYPPTTKPAAIASDIESLLP